MAQRVILVVLAALLLGLQWRLWVAKGGIAHTHRLKVEVAQQAANNERLRARNAKLDAEVQDLNSGVVAIEGRARETMGMIKEGETFYLVVQR
ncbi:cell division protein FtsB [Solimonas marina]|uniref:Cell division protein FtsB n=1 Tax=Solimonas marina TaxID=2714601 RepID=A0A969WED2_9GAMM|nr:cell division protein FtsB [Solimonas marina]NKF24483.1 cell division protein FtsB [Solimonas marina]